MGLNRLAAGAVGLLSLLAGSFVADAAAAQDSASFAEAMSQGEDVFRNSCAACHGESGGGEGGGPSLISNFRLQDDDKVIRTILMGGGYMPGFSFMLSDAEIAAVATYIRNTWGNSHGQVGESQVVDLR